MLVAVDAMSVVLDVANVGDPLVESVELQLVVVLVPKVEVAAMRSLRSVPSRAVDASIAVGSELDMSVDADDSSVRVVALGS